MTAPDFNDFVVLVRQSGLPHNEVDLERLFDGYRKLRTMMQAVNRPSDLTTGLAISFRPEPVE